MLLHTAAGIVKVFQCHYFTELASIECHLAIPICSTVFLQVKLMREYKRSHGPSKMSTETWSSSHTSQLKTGMPTSQQSNNQSASSQRAASLPRVNGFTAETAPATRSSPGYNADGENMSMTVQVSQVRL